MMAQLTLFGGEDLIAKYRQEDENEANRLLEMKRLEEEREALSRNPSLLDFGEIEKILDKTKCRARLRCTRSQYLTQSEGLISPEIRKSILRSFVTLHLWDAMGGSLEKIEVWLKTPKTCFENETPEEFSFHCWHCTTKWMKQVFALKGQDSRRALLT